MAMSLFASAIVEGRPVRMFNYGQIRRDFTYIDDVAQAVVRLLELAPAPNPNWSESCPDPASSSAPWRVYNIGNNRSVEVCRVLALLEAELSRPAIIEFEPMQPGDVPETCADVDELARDVQFRPETAIEEGVRRFVTWYCAYHRVPAGAAKDLTGRSEDYGE